MEYFGVKLYAEYLTIICLIGCKTDIIGGCYDVIAFR